jgi:hypothetical protein
MKKFTIIVSEAEEKALSTVMIDIQEWVQNAISNRARQAIDKIISDTTSSNPKKLNEAEREQIIIAAKVKTAVEINAEAEAELRSMTGGG